MYNPLALEVKRKIGDFRQDGDEYIYCCPFCVMNGKSKDTKFHFYVNFVLEIKGIQGWYNCFRCSSSGTVDYLLKMLSIGKLEDTKIDLHNWKKTLLSKLNNKQKEVEKKQENVDLPLDYMEVINGSEAHRYLEYRGISLDIIRYYRIGFGEKNLLTVEDKARQRYAGSGRIVFPDFGKTEEKCIYWLARTYKGHKVKYKNCKSSSRDKIYNYYRSLAYKNVIVTEGPISAINAGKNAVCIYGKGITKQQIKMLVNGEFDTYYFALDGDLKVRNYFFIMELLKYNCNCKRVVLTGEEDPANVNDFQDRVKAAKSFTLKTIVSML